MIKFEWDSTKESSNIRKHGISFEEASSIFYDDFAVQFYDDNHSELEEDRFLMLGVSNKTRILMVCYCERQSGNVLRKATKNEQKFYRGK